MKLAIMQPYIFPYIGYFQLVYSVDKFVFYDDVQFIKKGWINRNRILLQGKEYLLTIPLKEASQNKLICEIEVSWGNKELFKVLQSIEHAYKKAPFFNDIIPLVKEVFTSGKKSIAALSSYSVEVVASYLNISKEFKASSDQLYNNTGYERAERLIDICKQENADEYINAIGGQTLYNKDYFLQKGIHLNFLQPTFTPYNQFSEAFVPGLSIVDVLMFNEKAKVKELLSTFELI
jgi:hypothetical protein